MQLSPYATPSPIPLVCAG